MDFDAQQSTRTRVGNSGSAVEGMTLDEILDRLKVERVDLLKLDLEGHEPSALIGAERSFAYDRIQRVYAEVNTREALMTLDDMLTPKMERRGLGVFNALYVRPPGRAAGFESGHGDSRRAKQQPYEQRVNALNLPRSHPPPS
jgi:hypothetical protein